jgi:hypothetical protein
MSEFINGMIFVCDENTAEDMFKYQIFGLPLTYLREMKILVPGKSALFLLEKQTNLIRGIFVPTSNAKKLIISDIWLHQDQCSFPSQIRFKLHSSFAALPKDSEFAPQFLRRMKVKGKFLDRSRVRSLVTALTSFQGAVKSEQQRYRNLHLGSSFLSQFSNFFPPAQNNYSNPNSDRSSACASLAFLQQQNELLRLENQVLKVRSQAEQEAEELFRERESLLRTRNKTGDSFGAVHPFDFDRFKELLAEASAMKRQTREPSFQPRGPYDVNAAQHFKHGYNDDNLRHDWDSMLPPIPPKYEEERWASPNHRPVGRGFNYDPLNLEHGV